MTTMLAGWVLAAVGAGGCVVSARRMARIRRAVAHAEHELRGPLAAIRFAVDLGLRQDGLADRQLRAVAAELRRTDLALGDLARGQHRCAPLTAVTVVDVHQVVGDSVEAWRPAAAARGVGLEFSRGAGRAPVLGDPVRLAQATGNLIANAIEHGGSRVRVTASRATAEIRVAVTDDGPGLPSGILTGEHRASFAFRVRRRHRSRQLAGTRPGRDGRGQGLAIVTGIAVAHGGRLRSVSDDTSTGPLAARARPGGAPRRCGASLVLELPAAPGT